MSMKVVLTIITILVFLAAIGWLGLKVKPKPFPAYPEQAPALKTIELPANLPAPVERFYRTLYGDRLPVIESAVISGRGRLRVNGIILPARFRFTHNAGQDYRHYIETTFFGLPVMTVNEYFVDGKSRLELPFGVSEGPKVDQGANLALWAEAVWMPSVWVADSQARWEPISEDTALLIVPFGETEERFVARFDPESGLLRLLESMRYKEHDSRNKILWLNEVVEWNVLNGHTVPVRTAVTWFDEGTPWAVFTVEEVVYNVDVSEYVKARGL